MSKQRKPGPSSRPSPGSNPPSSAGAGAPDPFESTGHPAAPEAAPSAPGSGDGEISLEDYDERPQQRQRLPEQRKEKLSFEIGGTVTGPREEAPHPSFSPDLFDSASGAGAGVGGWDPATPDEIANYDVSTAAPASKPVVGIPPAPAPAPVEKKAAGDLGDIEEFIARTAVETPAADKPAKVRRPFSLVEKVCFGAGGAILLTLSIWLIHAVVAAADGGPVRSSPVPSLPMKGSLITLTDAVGSWRKSVKDVDRVEQIEVALPTPGHFDAGIIPELTFSIDSSASSNGFLRIIFRDPDGKASGDTRVVHVAAGKVIDPGTGGSLKGDTSAVVYCSSGLLDTSAYRAYVGGDSVRWSIEVAESNAYDSNDKDWKILGTFDVKNSLAQ